MKSGSKQSDGKTQIEVCSMCGAGADDVWETRPTRPIVLRRRPRPGDIAHIVILCDECDEGFRGLVCKEGLQNTALPKPDQVHLLSQARRGNNL